MEPWMEKSIQRYFLLWSKCHQDFQWFLIHSSYLLIDWLFILYNTIWQLGKIVHLKDPSMGWKCFKGYRTWPSLYQPIPSKMMKQVQGTWWPICGLLCCHHLWFKANQFILKRLKLVLNQDSKFYKHQDYWLQSTFFSVAMTDKGLISKSNFSS